MKAVIYTRYSSDNQREESIDTQLRACREYCNRQGWDISGEYIDQALTATSDDRLLSPDDLTLLHHINRRTLSPLGDTAFLSECDQFGGDGPSCS